MILVFLLPILTGGLLVHLLWPDRAGWAVFLKAFLGIGVGLGIWSLLYFLYMLLLAGQHWFSVIGWVIFLVLLAVTVWNERKRGWDFSQRWKLVRPARAQAVLLAFSGVIFLVIGNFIADLLLAWSDPRIRLK